MHDGQLQLWSVVHGLCQHSHAAALWLCGSPYDALMLKHAVVCSSFCFSLGAMVSVSVCWMSVFV